MESTPLSLFALLHGITTNVHGNWYRIHRRDGFKFRGPVRLTDPTGQVWMDAMDRSPPRKFVHWLVVAALSIVGVNGTYSDDVIPESVIEDVIPWSDPPPTRPQYRIDVRVDTRQRTLSGTETVTWTNPGRTSTDEVWFHVYPRHRPAASELPIYERTLESFRLDARACLDREGRRLSVESIKSGTNELSFAFDESDDTLLKVKLPATIEPGQSIELLLQFTGVIPAIQGRFGQFKGVTNLWNWYPMLAVFDQQGWDAPPFVAWHQPWLIEAADYDVSLTLPAGEDVASGAAIVSTEPVANGWKCVRLKATALRDLAIVASRCFEVQEAEVEGVSIRVLGLAEHRSYTRLALKTAIECFQTYTRWFGPYPYRTFTIAETHFGWNGNETGGMVLIDERVFAAPWGGHRYIESLLSHEICHQWWYGIVGTDGFREPWMDEGLASHLNTERLRKQFGENFDVLDWPRGFQWLPNISYHTLQHTGYLLHVKRGGKGTTLSSLPELGHIYNLFFLVYDRGSKIVGMIHDRLGDDRFFAFLRVIQAKYRFRILRVADFEAELEQFTGESWKEFFDDWLRSEKRTDWSVDHVQIRPIVNQDELSTGYATTITIRQRQEIFEPVDLGVRLEDEDGFPHRYRINPQETVSSAEYSLQQTSPTTWEVTIRSKQRPIQIELDPGRHLAETEWKNNRWKAEPAIRLTPLFTPLDEIPLVHPLDRLSIVAGPSVDVDGRIGLRAAFIEANRYRVSPFLAYTGNDAQLSTGFNAEIYNVPGPNLSIGTHYEHTLLTGLFNDPIDQGRIFLRYTHRYTTSYIIPNLAYAEGYVRFGDNFFPDEDFRRPTNPNVEDYRNIRAFGVALHANTQMPYWNPEKGWMFDVAAEHGMRLFNKGETFNRTWGQYSAVRRLPDELPAPFDDIRVAGRLGAGIGSPDRGEHFRFGGPNRFRGQRSEDTEGSAFWLASTELRVPLFKEIDLELIDNFANFQSLYSSLFYDVGESFLFNRSQGIDHAVGIGLHFQVGLVSFLEILTVRMEYAHSLGQNTDVVWFGLYQAF